MSSGDTTLSTAPQFETAARGMLDEAGGRVTSMGVEGEVVGRLQKAFDGLTVAGCGIASILMLAPPHDRFELTGTLLVVLLAMFVHMFMIRETGGYFARGLINPMRASVKALAGIVIAVLVGPAALAAIGPGNALIAASAWWAAMTAAAEL